MGEQRRGVLLGICAYALWGLFPLYWVLLRPSSAGEVLAHRFVWAAVFIGAVMVGLRRLGWLRELRRRPAVLGALVAAAALIAINWWTYIHGVNTGRVIETALGYFLNPLVSILLGVVVLKERLRVLQWVAVGIGALALVILTVDYGHLPWIAVILAATFSLYSLVKKMAAAPPLEGMAVESGVAAPFALAYLAWLQSTGSATFPHVSLGHSALIAVSGIVTAVPLLLFAAATNRTPLSVLGVVQYIAPTLQFAVGVLVFQEPMPPVRWIGFVLIWTALAIFTVDGLRPRPPVPPVAGRVEAVVAPDG